MDTPIEILKLVGGIVLSFWWLWLPLILFRNFFRLWLLYARVKFWKNLDWILLEIVPPRIIMQSPKAAESIFAGLWSFWGTVATKVDKYIKGAVQEYFSLEIIGSNGEIHFYVRCPRARRNHVEAQFYAQYPNAEIFEVEDYVNKVPNVVKSAEWDIWGTGLRLDKADAYPIRTYMDFIDAAPVETSAAFIDPLASMVETLNKLRDGEQLWIHLYCRPVDDSWKDEGQKIVDKIMGREVPAKKPLPIALIEGLVSFFFGGGDGVTAQGPAIPKSFLLSEDERSVLKALDRSTSKKGYQCKLQWAYMGRKDVFSKANIGAIMGVFNQFNDLSLNGFKPDPDTMTRAAYFLVEPRLNFKKRLLFESMKVRKFFEKGFVLNTEELATVFHFPAINVEAPGTPRTEAKKGTPPSGLPVG